MDQNEHSGLLGWQGVLEGSHSMGKSPGQLLDIYTTEESHSIQLLTSGKGGALDLLKSKSLSTQDANNSNLVKVSWE